MKKSEPKWKLQFVSYQSKNSASSKAKKPKKFLSEFESRFIRARDSETELGKRKTSRARVIWKASQKMIQTIGHQLSEWIYHTYEIYDYFHPRQYSIRYIHKIIKLANL
jgi:hypothetical protein